MGYIEMICTCCRFTEDATSRYFAVLDFNKPICHRCFNLMMKSVAVLKKIYDEVDEVDDDEKDNFIAEPIKELLADEEFTDQLAAM